MLRFSSLSQSQVWQLFRVNKAGFLAALVIGSTVSYWAKYAAAAFYIGWMLMGGQ